MKKNKIYWYDRLNEVRFEDERKAHFKGCIRNFLLLGGLVVFLLAMYSKIN